VTTGYSDRINHALAFAAKHHDQQVRKGTRLPYITQPANVAVILTRYDGDDETVVSGILFTVVDDLVRAGSSQALLSSRIGEKFGEQILRTVLGAVARGTDDDGVPLSPEESREDLLLRLANASESSRWVCAANALHHASTTLADLRRTEFPDSVWERYALGRERMIRWHRDLARRLAELGFVAPIVTELSDAAGELEQYSRRESKRTDARTPSGS
jgi:hypothetical protein